ncbi:MAG: 4Fe-4S binding protein [Kiritimatiellae bacterium]|nr:4Fe-4S binding protein [Kiritimatiellia bacterium]
MPRRKVIEINEELCNGCGECVTACAEGALQIVNGKAKLVREDFCDGFGDCVGECPTGALKIVERDVPDYDPIAARHHVAATGGEAAARRFDEVARRHTDASPPAAAHTAPHFGGCPGTRVRIPAAPADAQPVDNGGLPPKILPSELRQWPVQLHLVTPGAPFFRGRELVIMSTCGPIASADAHWRFLRGRAVVVACPKLDRTEPYVPKLAAILADRSIPRAIVVRMEVPCCGGLTAIAQEALHRSGREDLPLDEVTLSLDGEVMETVRVAGPA